MSDVSVIVPMFNAEQFLPNCLATIERNHSEGTQFILIDDHSSDETPRLLERAAKRLPYLTLLRNDSNMGVARSRNLAMAEVKRRYLTYLDVDDWYAPGHLDALVRAIERLGADFVRTDHVRTVGTARTLVRAPSPSRNQVIPASSGVGRPGEVSMIAYPFLWAGIYDTTTIAAELFVFDETLRTAADRPWFWRLYMSNLTTANVDLHGYFYRKDPNPAALTQAGNTHTLHFLDAIARTRDLVLASGREDYIVTAAYGACRMVAFHIAKRNRLSPELQQGLYAGAHELLASFPEAALRDALKRFSYAERVVLGRIINRKTH